MRRAPLEKLPDDPEGVMERGSGRSVRATGPQRSRPITTPWSAGPAALDFSRRLRLCEIHFKLNRRYSDSSFRNILLWLPHEQAVDLYDEVLERIQTRLRRYRAA